MKKIGLTWIVLFVIGIAYGNCRVDSVLTYKYDAGLSTKKLDQIEVRHYNTSNSFDTIWGYYKNAAGAWIKSGRTIYTYNAANLVTELLNQGYDTTLQQWKNGNRVVNTYDGANNLTQELIQNWNGTLSAWENNYLKEYTYDANKNAVSYHSKIWSSSVWVNEHLDSTTYTATNKPSIFINRNWNTTTNTWEIYSRRIYYYSLLDSITQIDLDYYNLSLGTWRHGYQDIYTYNANNLLVTLDKKRWKDAIFDYDNYFKYGYTYFPNKQPQEMTILEWNTTTLAWNNYSRDTYEHYASNDLSALEEYRVWLTAGSYYQYHRRYEYKCIAGTVSIENVNNGSTLSIYPNPLSTGILTVESNETQHALLMDISGKVILESDLQKGENKLDVRHLSSGMYLVKTKQQTQKLVVE